MAQYWTKAEKPYVLRMAIGASAATMGYATVLSCVNPVAGVVVPPIPFPIPMWLQTVGIAIYSLLATQHGWSPEVGHLSHFGGMAFGAFWWLVALRPLPVGYQLFSIR